LTVGYTSFLRPTDVPIHVVAAMAPDWTKAKLATLSIFELIDRVPRIDTRSQSGQKPSRVVGCPTIDAARFNYPSRPDVNVLQGLTVAAERGTTVALVGPSGSGKSTVVAMLERFYDADDGRVALDGILCKDWNLPYLREQMALVGQEPVLFSGSVKDNILYGAIGSVATDGDVEAAARAANIHDFVASLPDGYNTEVGAKGTQVIDGCACSSQRFVNPNYFIVSAAEWWPEAADCSGEGPYKKSEVAAFRRGNQVRLLAGICLPSKFKFCKHLLSNLFHVQFRCEQRP
jgi:ABC-type multidrug transport system fused ATPase/permease subunit